MKIAVIIGFIVIVLLQVTIVAVGNNTSIDSIEVSKLKAQTEMLREQNLHLRTQVLENQALRKIASRAADMGFSEGDVERLSNN